MSPRYRRMPLVLMLVLASPAGCMSRCDPAVVPMPPGFEEVSFNTGTGDVLRRGAKEYGDRLVVWRGDQVIELSHRADADRFKSFYEACDDTEVCDEVVYDFERGEGGYLLTLVRFGRPLLSSWKAGGDPFRGGGSTERCDRYKAMARDLWGEPERIELDGDLEVFEINDRILGAVLCTELNKGELFVAKAPRIEEMVR